MAPEDAETLKNEGDTLRSMGRFEEALDAYQKAASLGYNTTEGAVVTLVDYGKDLLASGNFSEALRSFDQALSLDPNLKTTLAEKVKALTGMGVAQESKGDPEGALSSYREALILSPYDVAALDGAKRTSSALKARSQINKINATGGPIFNGSPYNKTSSTESPYNKTALIEPSSNESASIETTSNGSPFIEPASKEQNANVTNEIPESENITESYHSLVREGEALIAGGSYNESLDSFNRSLELESKGLEAWIGMKGLLHDGEISQGHQRL